MGKISSYKHCFVIQMCQPQEQKTLFWGPAWKAVGGPVSLVWILKVLCQCFVNVSRCCDRCCCWCCWCRLSIFHFNRDANLWRSKIWRFFPSGLPTPPPSINLPTPPPLLSPPPLNAPTHPPAAPSESKNILPPLWIWGKTGYLCQEFLLVNRRSNQTIGYMAMIAKGSHFV